METATLTKIIANTNHPRVSRDLRDITRLHQVLTNIACPDDLGPSSRAAVNLLFRAERNSTRLLVQSESTLDPTKLPSGYLIDGQRSMDPLLDSITDGLRVRYMSRVNATVTRNSRRFPLRTVPEIEAWWQRTAEKHGFAVETVSASAPFPLFGRKSRSGMAVTITASDVTGVATITDADRAREAVLRGVGRARAYGCGLVSLARAS